MIVVCREFDWKNDDRQRRLAPPDSTKQVEISEFPYDEVVSILTDEGFDTASFRKGQLQLLRLPQNLSLFLEADFGASPRPVFGTAKELFDRYWNAKRKAVEERVAQSSAL